MSIPHENILVTLIPDDYHIRFAGNDGDGRQIFVTPDLNYDSKQKQTTDYLVVYRWESDGDFIGADVTKIGVRGQYENESAAKAHREIEQSISGFTPGTIRVRPCQFFHDGVEFGFIPRTDDDFTVVEVMPGNCLCFLEPFDGEYDT